MPETTSLDSAAKSLADFAAGPVASATRSIESAVDRTFTAMEHAIAKAVVSGKASISDLVTSVLKDLDRIAVNQYVTEPLENALSQIVSAILPVGGARATGGPVDEGSAYLVGENGPEMFVPQTSGTVLPNASLKNSRGAITLNVQARDAASFLASESQLAAMLTRALARGQRNL